jgi:hypothetical protein
MLIIFMVIVPFLRIDWERNSLLHRSHVRRGFTLKFSLAQ